MAAIVALVQQAYRGEASRRGWTTEADLLDGQRTDEQEVRELLASGRGRFVLAFEAEQLVASMWLEDQPWGLYLGMIAVHPEAQGQGVGKQILLEAERRARAHLRADGPRLRMTVIAQRRELIEWYARRGFHATGAQLPFPYDQPRFGLPRRGDLYFVVLEKHLTD